VRTGSLNRGKKKSLSLPLLTGKKAGKKSGDKWETSGLIAVTVSCIERRVRLASAFERIPEISGGVQERPPFAP
jgi:hypothetical protein